MLFPFGRRQSNDTPVPETELFTFNLGQSVAVLTTATARFYLGHVWLVHNPDPEL